MGVEHRIAPEEVLRFRIGERDALRMVSRRFDGWLDYHWTKHTSHVIENTGAILRAMQDVDPESVTEKDVCRGRLIAAFHDVEQAFEIEEMEVGRLRFDKIVRDPLNEMVTTSIATAYMREHGFSESDITYVVPDISCTIAVPDPEFPGGFYQPDLQTTASLTGMAIGLADLGCAGMEGPDRFHEDGASWFRELFVGVRELVSTTEPSQIEDLRGFMLSWLEGQVAFAKGRKERTEQEIGLLPSKMQESVRALFPHFDATIAMTRKNVRLAQQFSLSELATFFGYGARH